MLVSLEKPDGQCRGDLFGPPELAQYGVNQPRTTCHQYAVCLLGRFSDSATKHWYGLRCWRCLWAALHLRTLSGCS